MDEEERISRFCSFTNATRDIANSFLELTGGNIEDAVTLYLESAESQVSGEGPANPNDTFESDAELAKRLAQEEEPEIRAPIAPKRDILVGDNDFGNYHYLSSRRLPHSHHVPRELYRNFTGELTTNNILDSTGESDRANSLDDLYRPPFDIMSKENFERTRTEARNKRKWLMVNIQDTSFSSLTLNFDLWRIDAVKDIIREHFLFLQFDTESTEGRRYGNFYPVFKFPHIAIIDPRTGERLKDLGVPDGQDNFGEFLMAVTEFLERYSLSETTPKRNVENSMTEQLDEDAALAASLSHDNDLLDQEPEFENMEDLETSPSSEGMPVSVFDSILPVERAQVQGPDVTTIKFRLADGKTVTRRFGKTDPVRHLFEYIKASIPEAREQPFELVCYSDNLIDKVDQAIEEAGLANAVVNMVLVFD